MSYYCENCRACGEEGCCSPLMCFSKLVEKDSCKYGKDYLKDITLAIRFSNWILDSLNKNDFLTAKQINKKHNQMIDEIYFSKYLKKDENEN